MHHAYTRPRTALVTEAISSLGFEFAKQLAQRSYDLVLIDTSASRLEAMAAQLRGAHGVGIHSIATNLGARNAVQSVTDELATLGISVDLLVNNPGFATPGRFASALSGRDGDALMVNLTALTGLTRTLVPAMLNQVDGTVINVGPVFTPEAGTDTATYHEAKTFILNFSLALHTDYHDHGVRVVALAPWPVDASYLDVVATPSPLGTRMITPRGVVRAAFKATGCDRSDARPRPAIKAATQFTPRREEHFLPAI